MQVQTKFTFQDAQLLEDLIDMVSLAEEWYNNFSDKEKNYHEVNKRAVNYFRGKLSDDVVKMIQASPFYIPEKHEIIGSKIKQHKKKTFDHVFSYRIIINDEPVFSYSVTDTNLHILTPYHD